MPQIPIIMPQLGESIAEATITNFLVKPGDDVEVDQEIIEVETNKATMNVTSPCKGKVARLSAELQESYPVGAILGLIEATAEDAARQGFDTTVLTRQKAAAEDEDAREAAGDPSRQTVQPTVRGLPVPAHAAGASFMSPRLKARMAELGLHAADLAGIAGSGAGGRVTIQDFEHFITSIEKHKQSPASSMRIAVADAMRRSWTRPIATVGLPIVLDKLFAHRRASNPKPGPALYALRALAVALAENSAPAGRLIGKKIVHPSSIDLGFAVEAEDGVFVPVIREADRKSLKQLLGRYSELIELCHQRKLPVEATGGSIGIVTNFGTFGLMWATPIPLPEQTLVLGVGAARKAPAWDEATGRFVPVMEANFTLSFDHRFLDGGAAGRLLTRIAALLNTPEVL
jgi:pyruvate/2-oxoglutarate dehydrogenase complex dihydrolipoamide acyltransferase (E2) component